MVTRQFDVFATPSGGRGAPMLVVLQSHLLSGLETVLVAPLIDRQELSDDHEVFIAISVEGSEYVLNLAQIASLAEKRLGRRLQSVAEHEDAIRRGLDRLFTGF